MGQQKSKDDKRELTLFAKILVLFTFTYGAINTLFYGILYLIGYAAFGFLGYVVFEHFFSIGNIGAIITVVVTVLLHLWSDGAFDKKEE